MDKYDGPCRTYGVSIPEGATLLVYKPLLGGDRMDPLWYGGDRDFTVASIAYRGRIAFLDAPGDIGVSYPEDLGAWESDPEGYDAGWGLARNQDELPDWMAAMGDDLMGMLGENDWLANNNWFETFYNIPGTNQVAVSGGEPMYDYAEALSALVDEVLDDDLWASRSKYLPDGEKA